MKNFLNKISHRKFLLVFVFLLAGILVVYSSPNVFAQVQPNGGGATIEPPIDAESIGAIVVRVINFLLTLIGGISVLFIIIGGFKMVASQGNPEAVKSGKQTATWAVVGLVIALMAFSIIAIVQNVLGRK